MSYNDKLYAHRNPMKQGEYYTKHVMAMTAEALHNKSDIAAELAHRDIEISRLRKELSVVNAARTDLSLELQKKNIAYDRALDNAKHFSNVAEQAERQLAGVVEVLKDIASEELGINISIKIAKQALANLSKEQKTWDEKILR